MAFPTGKTTSGVKSDTREGTYEYRTGVQPNGTPSIGNWNTGGTLAGIGNSKGVYDASGRLIGGSPPKVGKGGMSELAALFQGGKGGPTGAIGSVSLPQIRKPVSVSLPPPQEIEQILQKQVAGRALTPQEMAMIKSWQQYSGNPFRWPTVARQPTSPSNPGYHTGTGPSQLPGGVYPNPGGGFNPGALTGGSFNQEQLKNDFHTPKYQQRVPSGNMGGWDGPLSGPAGR